MLIGYARVSKANGSQSLDLQRDALRAEGVDAVNVYPTGTNLSRLRSMGFSRTSRRRGPRLPARRPISTTLFPLVPVVVAGLEFLFFRSQVPLVAAVVDWVQVVEEEVVVRAARLT